MNKLTTLLKCRLNIITALVMVGLALTIETSTPSPVVARYEEIGISAHWLAGFLFGGAVVTSAHSSRANMIVGTIPYVWYVLSTVYIVFERQGGYAVALVYTFSYLQLIALYPETQNGGCNG